MSMMHQDALWHAFPRTALEFEERFASEDDFRAFWIEARWNGHVTCQACGCTKVWALRDGRLYECAQCGHQTSLTSGTLLAGTRKPLKAWFRAFFEISVHRHGIY